MSEVKSFCAECFEEDCELLPTRANGDPMPWSEVVEHSHRMLREHWEEPHKSRYGPTTTPPIAALHDIQSNFNGKLAAHEAAYAMGMTSEEVYLNHKAYALWGLAYVSLLLNEFDDAEEYYNTFMNVNLAYFNADHEDPERGLFIFQRTLKAGHGHFCATKYDLKGQKPCATTYYQYADIVANPLLALGIKSFVPFELSKFIYLNTN